MLECSRFMDDVVTLTVHGRRHVLWSNMHQGMNSMSSRSGNAGRVLDRPVRVQVKDVAVPKPQEFFVLFRGHSGLAWQPDQLAVPCLGGQHGIALISGQVGCPCKGQLCLAAEN